MLLTITTTHEPATDMGFLLHKRPDRCQEFSLSFGKALVFYPEAEAGRCTAALLLDVDPIGMVRGKKGGQGGLLDQYVNDRPYVASSFMSVAISRVFGSALQGRCKDKPELAKTPIPLSAKIAALPSRGGEKIIKRLFEPLGYEMAIKGHTLDPKYPEWGQSQYFSAEWNKRTTLSELLTHLYVLIPVLDNAKHYYVGDDEVEKLLARGKGWLEDHPERDFIARRYLKFKKPLAVQALARLAESREAPESGKEEEAGMEARMGLNEARIGTVLSVLKSCGAKSVADLGCGEGKLLKELLKDRRFEKILGMDVSVRNLSRASGFLRMERLAPLQKERIELVHGSLMYRDSRLEGFDAACVIEVVEHLDPPRLQAFERVLFECARPGTVVLTTPNREFNVNWENVGPDALRHRDHRFEWTRREFRQWADTITLRYPYRARFLSVGPEDPETGPPTQMVIFER